MSEGSMSTVSKEEVLAQDYAGFSEISSFSTVNGGMICGHEEEEVEKELELGLGLSVGNVQVKNHVPREYCRILTAQDFPSLVGVSSSCSSPSVDRNCAAGRKRTAESSVVSQVVGWPPVRTHMMNSLANHTRVSSYNDCEEDSNSKHAIKNSRNCKNKSIQDKNHVRSLFVKVNMDGVPIGRKVDLSAHACYETLAQTLEGMFQTHTNKMIRNYGTDREDGTVVECSKTSKLLDGSSEFVLTYEDKEGDWMLVGDVPWRMFLSSVKRLRIMRTSEAKGLDPGFQDKNVKQKSKPM